MKTPPKILHIAPQVDYYCPFDTLKDCSSKCAADLLDSHYADFRSADLIIIDSNYMLDDEFEGIKLLKLIRLHYIRTHCIVYSFVPESFYVRADANKSILLSEGVTYVQMPKVIDDSTFHFEHLVDKKSPERLEDFFLHDYRMCFSGNRHFHANWWAPCRILEYLRRADGTVDEEAVFGPDAQKSRTSYYGRVLRYIKTMNEGAVWDSVMEDIIANNSRLEKKNKQLSEAKNPIEEAIGKNIEDERLRAAVVESAIHPIDVKIGENQEVIASTSDEVQSYRQKKDAMYAVNESTETIEELRTRLSAKLPKILFLDDMADFGWKYVLQKLIYRKETSLFDVEQSFKDINDSDYESYATRIKQRVEGSGTDLIIMDLRLKDERGEMRPQDLSGIKLLEAFRKVRIACPIMVITASKDPDTIEQVYKSGADACWRKEGIDENNYTDAQERVAYTCRRIEQLLKAVYSLCGEKFRFLYQTMLPYFERFSEGSESYWWEKTEECLPEGSYAISITREFFCEKLLQAFIAYRSNLVDMLKGCFNGEEFLTPINLFFEIVDRIHPYDNGTDSSGNVNKACRDWKISGSLKRANIPFLLEFQTACLKRNYFIHHLEKSPKDITSDFEVFQELFCNLMGYFTVSVETAKAAKVSAVHNQVVLRDDGSCEQHEGWIEIKVHGDSEAYELDRTEMIKVGSFKGQDKDKVKFALKRIDLCWLGNICRTEYPTRWSAIVNDVSVDERETRFQLREVQIGRYGIEIEKTDGQPVSTGPCKFLPSFFKVDGKWRVALNTSYQGDGAWSGTVEDGKLTECHCPDDTWFKIDNRYWKPYHKVEDYKGNPIWFEFNGRVALFAFQIEKNMEANNAGGTRGN